MMYNGSYQGPRPIVPMINRRPPMGQAPGTVPPNLLAGGAATNLTQQQTQPPQQIPQQPQPNPFMRRQPLGGQGAGPIIQQPPTMGKVASINPPAQQGGVGGGNVINPQSNPFNPTGVVGGGGVYNPVLSGGDGIGLGNPVLFNTNPPQGGGGSNSGGASLGSLRGGAGYNGPNPNGGTVAGGNQQGGGGAGIAQQLQSAQDAANAKNDQRYNQQLDLNQSGQQNQLAEQNTSYSGLSGMPGQSANRQNQLLQGARSDQLGAINSAQQKLDTQAQQAGQSQAAGATSAYAGLLKNADARAGKTQGFVDTAYGNLKNTAQQGGQQSMGFLNQQNAGMQGLLNSYSNADYGREHQQTQQQLAQIALDMADRGLSSDTLDQSLKRGVYDDSAMRQAEIGDRRVGRALDVANSYTGRGLGVLGDTNQQQFAAGSAYANAGLNSRQNADSQALNIAGRGVDTSLDAQRSADAARLGLGQSFANQDINARGDLNRAGLNIAADQGAREQGLASQYAGQRQQTMENANNQRINIIGARTDQGPDEGAYLGLLSQAGASGRNVGGGGQVLYNGGLTQGGHVGGSSHGAGAGGNPFGDPFNFAGGGGGAGYSGGGNSSYDPYGGHLPPRPGPVYGQDLSGQTDFGGNQGQAAQLPWWMQMNPQDEQGYGYPYF